jgi:hypothetical protein
MHDYWYYHDYIHSDKWKAKASVVKKLQGNICHLCGMEGNLDAHHKTYVRLGNELREDLVGLCNSCHSKIHFLVEHYCRSYASYEEALRWSWQDAVMLGSIPYEESCILCGDTQNLSTSYNVDHVLDDLMNICEKCRWQVFAKSAHYRAQFCPHNVSLAYGLREAKRTAKLRNKKY